MRLDKRRVGFIPDLQQLPQQQMSLQLQNGSVLGVALWYSGAVPSDIVLTLDGVHLKAEREAAVSLAAAWGAIFFVAAVNLLAGLGSIVPLQPAPWMIWLFGIGGTRLADLSRFEGTMDARVLLLVGSVYWMLGVRVKGRSWRALAAALGLFTVDSVVWLIGVLVLPAEGLAVAAALLTARLSLVAAMATGLDAFDGSEVARGALELGIFRTLKEAAARVLAAILYGLGSVKFPFL